MLLRLHLRAIGECTVRVMVLIVVLVRKVCLRPARSMAFARPTIGCSVSRVLPANWVLILRV